MPEDKERQLLHTIRSYGKSVMGFIRSRVRSEEDAEDIMQDVWYQLSAVVNSQPIEQTGAWLYRVARNRIIDKNRKRSEELYENRLSDEEDDIDFRAMLLTETATPETEFIRNIFWDQLFGALNELPAEQKDVFISHELDGISFEDLASASGINIQTLVSRKRYAVLHLRKRLKDVYRELNEV